MSYFFSAIAFYSRHSDAITVGACLLIVFMSILMLSLKGARANLVPSLAISGGIFFTFLGLAISLTSVSNSSMQLTFKTLLAGLSTAFWTSVVGMFMSIVAKIILAGRASGSPLRTVQNEVALVRQEISGLGRDISEQLGSAMTQYSQTVTASFSESSEQIVKLNNTYEESLNNLSKGIDGLLGRVNALLLPVAGVVSETENLLIQTDKLLKTNGDSLAQQAAWIKSIEDSVGAITHLAPEAKCVFESIDRINQSVEDHSREIDKKLEESHLKFGKNVEKTTSDAIDRMINIESVQHNRIVEQLEKIDQVVKESFDVVMNQYGQGVLSLVQKKLEVVAGIVAHLEYAKVRYEENLSGNDTIKKAVEA